MRALSAALPAMMEGLSKAQAELERATANMPRPDYPKALTLQRLDAGVSHR